MEFFDREFDSTAGAEEALDQARAHGWTVISIENDMVDGVPRPSQEPRRIP
jgi:hypothetical protein